MKYIAIFASGGGSNAAQIIKHFSKNDNITVSLIICNNSNAGVLDIAKENNISTVLITKNELYQNQKLLDILQNNNIDFIVLAGFLWLVPNYIVTAFPKKIVNIHPALLPNYGGKGMYGHHVHEAVWQANEKYTGMTIHYADEEYDKGEFIYQAKCKIDENDTAQGISKKVLALEHFYYPKVIESLCK